MKKLIVVVALLFVPLLATAQQPDALLTPDGTLYTVQFERAADHPDVVTDSAAYLKLTARRGEEVRSEIIPSTLDRGGNYSPTIAYDAQSGMLFVFWIHNQGMVLNQLMFTSRTADGIWSDARVFGDGYYDQRKNLRVAVTRKFRDEGDDIRSGLSVHLAWWELNTTTGKGSAKYAMASIHGGEIVDFTSLDLSEFVSPIHEPGEAAAAAGEINKDLLKQPVLFTTPLQESVVLLFGDIDSGTLNQVRITPRKIIANGRLRVPGGRREGGFRAPLMALSADSRIEGVYVDSNRLALYTVTEGKLSYVLSNGKRMTEPFAITLDQSLPAASAVDALRRLVNEHENEHQN
jgi:hypothetical protein